METCQDPVRTPFQPPWEEQSRRVKDENTRPPLPSTPPAAAQGSSGTRRPPDCGHKKGRPSSGGWNPSLQERLGETEDGRASWTRCIWGAPQRAWDPPTRLKMRWEPLFLSLV